MGAIGGLLGLGGGAGGTSFSGPQGTNINANQIASPVTQQILNTGYAGQQGALASQQGLLQALQAQNGLGNQSNVYNQLQGVAAGTGPNPAQAMLNQATGQNVANQAALMAGQRGASSNVGLLARQAAQQGAGIQQQAVGQGATLQANQALNALGQAGNIANTQASNQIGATNANTQAQQNAFNNELNAQLQTNATNAGIQNASNTANVGMQSSQNTANASMANTQMQGTQAGIGGLGNIGATALGILKAKGGEITASGPQSSLGQYLAGNMAMGGATHDYRAGGNVAAKSSSQKAVVSGNSYANDKIPAVLSEGEVVIPRNVMESKDPAMAAAKFVQSVLAKRKVKS